MGGGGFLMNFKDFKDYSRIFVNPGLGLTVPLAKSTLLSFTVGLFTQFDRGYITPTGHGGYRDSFINMKLGLLFGKYQALICFSLLPIAYCLLPFSALALTFTIFLHKLASVY